MALDSARPSIHSTPECPFSVQRHSTPEQHMNPQTAKHGAWSSLPKLQLAVVYLVLVCEPLSASVIFPFVAKVRTGAISVHSFTEAEFSGRG